MISGIYKILNIKNKKIYIGSAVHINKRWNLHKCLLQNNKHHSTHLQYAWNKDGEDSFKFIVVEHCPKEKLIQREQYWMDYYKSYDSEFGYNLYPIAGNALGSHHTKATKEKIRKANLGRIFSPETIRKMKAYKRTKAHCKAISLGKRGKSPKPTSLELSIDWNFFKKCIRDGLTNKQIAEKFNIKWVGTVVVYCKKRCPRLFKQLKRNNKEAQVLNGKNLWINGYGHIKQKGE